MIAIRPRTRRRRRPRGAARRRLRPGALREDLRAPARRPAAGEALSLVAQDDGRLVGTVRLWNVSAGPAAAPPSLLGPLAVDRLACARGPRRPADARRAEPRAARSRRGAAGRRRALLRALRLFGGADGRPVAAGSGGARALSRRGAGFREARWRRARARQPDGPAPPRSRIGRPRRLVAAPAFAGPNRRRRRSPGASPRGLIASHRPLHHA